jgi:endonuclease YncB( thermonuclease family)
MRPRARVLAPPRRGFRPRPRPRGPAGARSALVWALAFVGLATGYSVLAPFADDLRSDLRPMSEGCAVGYVIDGDTVELRCADGRELRARITGYDSPELFSPRCPAEAAAADAARRALAAMVDGASRTEVAFLGRDRYRRELVDMRLDGTRVATAMVDAGHGRRYFGALREGWCG